MKQLLFWCSVLVISISTFVGTPSRATAFGSDLRARKYPKDFLWGVAFSAHQTEGVAGGGEHGDWWQFEHSKGNAGSPIKNGDTTQLAVDHWNRFDEDFSLAQQLGSNTVRISIAWEKIEPQSGVFNTEAIAHYRDVLKSMRAHGLKPMIAFHHFTHPVWFHEKGGWTKDESSLYFLRYAANFVFQSLNDLCDLWITFNEPAVYVSMGYIQGSVPPLIKDQKLGVLAAFNMVKAHLMTVAMIHARQPETASVGVVNSLQIYEPANKWNPGDLAIAEFIDHISNWAFLEAMVHERIALRDKVFVTGILGYVPSLDFPNLNRIDGTAQIQLSKNHLMDWLGVNYYTKFSVSTGFGGVKVEAPKGPSSDNGYLVYPEGLRQIVQQTAKRFHVPLIVSENGLADGADTHRPEFVRKSFAVIDDLLFKDHIDVRGYYHWSLMDNFEWLLGYTMKFGLIEVDFKNELQRKPRPSAWVFRDEIQARQDARRSKASPLR